jgi:hypothetical protein
MINGHYFISGSSSYRPLTEGGGSEMGTCWFSPNNMSAPDTLCPLMVSKTTKGTTPPPAITVTWSGSWFHKRGKHLAITAPHHLPPCTFHCGNKHHPSAMSADTWLPRHANVTVRKIPKFFQFCRKFQNFQKCSKCTIL